MAGKGPAPKKPAERRNRTAPARGEWVTLPVEPYSGDRPDLPRVKGGLLKATKETWDTWWRSPMAHMWTTSDWPILTQLIVMTDRITRALARGEFFQGYASMVTEARHLRDQLGITEKGRQDLRWELSGHRSRDAEDETEGKPHLAVVRDIGSRKRPDPRKK